MVKGNLQIDLFTPCKLISSILGRSKLVIIGMVKPIQSATGNLYNFFLNLTCFIHLFAESWRCVPLEWRSVHHPKIKRFSRAQNSKVASSVGLEGVLHVDLNSSFGLFPVVHYTLGKYDML